MSRSSGVEAREREGLFVLAPSCIAVLMFIVRADARRDPLSTVVIDPELLPTDRIAECSRSVLRERMPSQYKAQGYRPLRAAIAKRLQNRGLDVEADEVVIRRARISRSTSSPVYAYAKLLFETLCTDMVGLHLDPFKGIDLRARGSAGSTARRSRSSPRTLAMSGCTPTRASSRRC
jgi:hypothetical protein